MLLRLFIGTILLLAIALRSAPAYFLLLLPEIRITVVQFSWIERELQILRFSIEIRRRAATCRLFCVVKYDTHSLAPATANIANAVTHLCTMVASRTFSRTFADRDDGSTAF